MIGSATAPPNPREWAEDRFATAEQKLIAEYNSECAEAHESTCEPLRFGSQQLALPTA